jgi:hypothetical protein
MQAGGLKYPKKFTLLVHATHYDHKGGVCDHGDKDPCDPRMEIENEADQTFGQLVLSNSTARPVYRVMLWYSNPYHFLTGWVEASISKGLPSQPDKHLGGEHPMWLVSGNTPLTSGRNSFTGSGLIDAFFDYWLPVFVRECRISSTIESEWHKVQSGQLTAKQLRRIAKDYGDENYQEVMSKDGVSNPLTTKGVSHYESLKVRGQGYTQGDYDDAAKSLHKDAIHKMYQPLDNFANKRIGQLAAKYINMEDLPRDNEMDIDND